MVRNEILLVPLFFSFLPFRSVHWRNFMPLSIESVRNTMCTIIPNWSVISTNFRRLFFFSPPDVFLTMVVAWLLYYTSIVVLRLSRQSVHVIMFGRCGFCFYWLFTKWKCQSDWVTLSEANVHINFEMTLRFLGKLFEITSDFNRFAFWSFWFTTLMFFGVRWIGTTQMVH